MDVLLLQELRWGPQRSTTNIPGYSAITQPRTSKGGGVAIYVRSSIPHKPAPSLNTTGAAETVWAHLELGANRLLVGSCYLPPPAQVPPALLAPSLQHHTPVILGGDFNCHHPWWSKGEPNHAGTDLKDQAEDTGFAISGLDAALATFPRNQGRPDLILASNLDERRTWTKETHISDHFPLITTYALEWSYPTTPHDTRLRYQFETADWAQFQATVDASLNPAITRRLHLIRQLKLQGDRVRLVDAGAAHFAQVLQKAATPLPKSVRRNGIPPFWNSVCAAADTLCNDRYHQFQKHGTDAKWHAYLEAKHARAETVATEKRRLFAQRVSSLDASRAADWNLVKSRDRGVDLRGTIIDGVADLRDKADLFATKFAPPTPGAKLRPPRHEAVPRVTPPELDAALRKTKRGKAPGPDGIYTEFLRDGLSPTGRAFLLALIDASLFTGYLPPSWKHAHWLPLPKPKKPVSDSNSYRPISLTSVVCKVAERVLDTRLRTDPAFHIDTRQHAFRRAHRTEDAIARLVDTANRAWNTLHQAQHTQTSGKKNWLTRSGRATATLLDLTSAFDNLRHDRLHQLLRQAGYPAYQVRWILAFLHGRTAQVAIHGVKSSTKHLTRGAPQGTVLGPLLFLIYIDPLLAQLREVENLDPLLFADDITLVAIGPTAAACAATTQKAVDIVMEWSVDNGMPVAPAKTKSLLLTPPHSSTSDESNPGLQVGDVAVPITREFDPTCKLLGVYIDPHLQFVRHMALTRAKAALHLRLIRHAITQMGPSTLTLRTFGKALVETRLFYAVGGWGATLSSYQITLLENVQREMARAATGTVTAAPSAGTLLEANLLPATVLIPTQVAALVERWRRLPATDHRNHLITRPLPSQPTQSGRIPYFEHPWTAAYALIARVLEIRSVPLNHTRLPVLVDRCIAPQAVAPAAHVHIRPSAPNTPTQLPEKGSPEGDQIREELNRGTWEELQTTYGPFTVEIWTDGGVLHPESPECISAAAGHLYLTDSTTPHDQYAASAGHLACSYTAEFVALTGSVRQFAPQIPDGSNVLIGVDSQSLLQALAQGPLLTKEVFEEELWDHFLKLARRDCQVVVQFFYSHVHFPPRNQTVDDEVTALLEDNNLDHDAPAIWFTDIVRAIRHQLHQEWLQSVNDHRTDLCGRGKAPLREMVAWSRADQTLFSRSRTDTLPELGRYRLRLGITASGACRWCGQHPPPPDSPVSDLPPRPAETTTPSTSATPSPRPRLQCPHCELTYEARGTLKAHMDRAHPRDPIPMDPTAFPCDCGRSFPTSKSRAIHRRACPQWQALAAQARPAEAPAQAPLHSLESMGHLLACPGLSQLRHTHNVHPSDHPPPASEAIHSHAWVAFLRAALALVAPEPAAPTDPTHHHPIT